MSFGKSGKPPDPGALSPGQEYPRQMYHATEEPQWAYNQEDEAALGPGWSRHYIYQAYPKAKYHWTKEPVTVKNVTEDEELGPGWADTPAEFERYRGARPPRTDQQDVTKWVADWLVPALSPTLRKRIRLRLLHADAEFERSADPDSAVIPFMRKSFSAIARVLFDAGILTEKLLQDQIPELVWDSACTAGWWRAASANHHKIFNQHIGRHWVWREESGDWRSMFRVECAEWYLRLSEANVSFSVANPSPSGGRQETLAGEVSDDSSDAQRSDAGVTFTNPTGESGTPDIHMLERSSAFTSQGQREAAISDYTQRNENCSEASLARTAKVHPADLSKWKKGTLPSKSEKKKRIESALMNNEKPIHADKRSTDS